MRDTTDPEVRRDVLQCVLAALDVLNRSPDQQAELAAALAVREVTPARIAAAALAAASDPKAREWRALLAWRLREFARTGDRRRLTA